ncbi:YfcC family protein [Neisseria weixii]|uniref:YfcC family protein n=1 Tax=Neisseria weixii TaxID=1853276 RepID=A0A3N4N0V2_9NEIS|nr:Na+/H+ antiporter NhaC family protein [Neisseria weixii]RPD85560.1 YfcC family protein [Neisseria weixii]RPD86108.1 YfcC family protein [Neisseria weixii]
MDTQKPKKSFKMPDIYIVLAVFILVAAVLTYIVPAGEYERQVVETAHGTQKLVVAGTYHTVGQQPVGFMDLVTAIPDGLQRAAGIVFLTFMVGGCMGLIKRAGLIDMGVQRLSTAVGGKDILVIPILIAIFSGLAAFIGVPELSLAYLPVLLPLFYRLGYDGMTATAVSLLGPCMGFTFGLTIPGSVGMGQQIAQLPMFSGSAFRAVVLAAVVLITVLYVMRYAVKVKRNPEASLTYDTDHVLRAAIAEEDAAKAGQVFTVRQKYAGIACMVLFPAAIFLILKNNLGFAAIGGLFLFIGITAAAVAGKSAQQICDDVNAGMRDMMVAALLCGVASAIAVVMDKGVITDTLVYWLEGMMRSVPSEMTAIAIFWEQAVFNFLIPGATALTVLTMPIISPLASLLDISQQAVVSANAWGGQLTDIFFPTSGFFVATLVIAKVEYSKWLRFYMPLMLLLGLLSSIALYFMQASGVGAL